MNEFFAADPKSFSDPTELRFFLKHFGPFAGRYLLSLPLDWKREVDSATKGLGDLDRSRISFLLGEALKKRQILRENWPWQDNETWAANVVPLLKKSSPPKLDGAIFGSNDVLPDSPKVFTVDKFLDSPFVAEESIRPTPEEYARVTLSILQGSEELVFVDPYLNLCNSNVYAVMYKLFECIGVGKAKRIVLWARASTVLDPETGGKPLHVFRERAQQLFNATIRKPQRELVINLLDDRFGSDRIHRRYVLSIFGGVWVEQGFQQLSESNKVPVGPIAENIHSELVERFIRGVNDYKIAHTFTVKSSSTSIVR